MQALIIDSWFDNFVGVITLVRIVNGRLNRRDKIQIISTGRTYNADSVGVFTPKRVQRETLGVGEVGYIIAGIKEIDAARVGDTISLAARPAKEALPGFTEVQPARIRGFVPGQFR